MKTILLLALISLSACGYSSRDNELSGQVKRVTLLTPIICPDRTDVHISLGIMRNGVGSMSHEDISATAWDSAAIGKLKEAAESGAIVKVKYNAHRFTWCQDPWEVTAVEILK